MPSTAPQPWFGLMVMLAITCGSGCATFQKDPGPVYRFARRDRAKPVKVTTVALKFRDRRPDWERKYHKPLVDPKRKQMGVELLTADNFDPNPINQFKQQLSAKLGELENPPTSAEVIIKRLHVVVKYASAPSKIKIAKGPFKVDSNQQGVIVDDPAVTQVRQDDAYVSAKKKWEQADRKAHANGTPSPPEPKYNDYHGTPVNDGGLLATVGEAVFVGCLNLAWMTASALPGLASESLETARFYANQGPPPAWAQVEPGVTCHMEGTVNLQWANGRQTTIPINLKQTETYDIALDTPNYEVTPFLAAVITKSVNTVATDATEYLATLETRAAAAEIERVGVARP